MGAFRIRFSIGGTVFHLRKDFLTIADAYEAICQSQEGLDDWQIVDERGFVVCHFQLEEAA